MERMIIRSHFIRTNILLGLLAFEGPSTQMVYTTQFGSTSTVLLGDVTS